VWVEERSLRAECGGTGGLRGQGEGRETEKEMRREKKGKRKNSKGGGLL
jgi:hypothetical protein